jgi:dTDP-4-amino-4,6-dideoxy-D-galactose acyltransferase
MFEPIEFLEWDSEFFGRRVGRANLKEVIALDECLQSANQQRYELLYIYSPIPIKASLISKYTFIDVGGHIAYARNLSGHALEEVKRVPEISEYQVDILTPELLKIAFLSGHLSRFKIDPLLPAGSYERLYETWLANTIMNRPKTAIYTYHVGGKIAGLITSESHGPKCTIDLLAVLQSCQGQGIGTKLINCMQDICIANNVASVEVKTQLSNISARALYLKNSFVEHERSFLYHAHVLG